MGTVYSPTLDVNPVTEPTGMDAITVVSVDPYNLTFSWPSLTPYLNGGDPPYYYEVEWYNSTDFVWTKMLNNEALGATYSYTHFSGENYFTPGGTSEYRVTPKNLVGWGYVPSQISILLDTYPSSMELPTLVSVNPKKIIVNWVELLDDTVTGRDPIIYYKLEWN